MKVIGLDGKEYNWLTQKSKFTPKSSPSSGHLAARKLLRQLFKCCLLLEEVPLPGSKTVHNGLLIADFVLPSEKLIVEVHGEQHYRYTPFFHNSKLDFIRGQLRDKKKKEWAELNGFLYLALPSNNVKIWKETILRRYES